MSEADELMRRVEEAHDRLARQIFQKDLGAVVDSTLTMQQVKVMGVLYSTGPLSGQELARRLGVSTPTVSGMADRLLERQMVHRFPAEHDKRVRLLALTEGGEERIRAFYEQGWQLGREMMSRMATDDLRALARGLSAMAHAVEELKCPVGQETGLANTQGDGDVTNAEGDGNVANTEGAGPQSF